MLVTKFYIHIVLAALFLFTNNVNAELSKEQGDAILLEMQKIRQLLERAEQRDLRAARSPKRQAKTPARIVTISSQGGSLIGKPDAPVTIVEFTDYQCPFCSRFFKNTYPQLKKNYIDTGKVRLVIKDLPLGFHPHARKAAQASRCAGDQGKFIAMHDMLYNNAKKLDVHFLAQYAQQIDLDVSQFTQCLNSERHLAQIDKDTNQAMQNGITGTPSFVIGKTTQDKITGKTIIGARGLASFKAEIEKLLK